MELCYLLHVSDSVWTEAVKYKTSVNKRSNLMQQFAEIYLLQSHSICSGRHSAHHQEY